MTDRPRVHRLDMQRDHQGRLRLHLIVADRGCFFPVDVRRMESGPQTFSFEIPRGLDDLMTALFAGRTDDICWVPQFPDPVKSEKSGKIG